LRHATIPDWRYHLRSNHGVRVRDGLAYAIIRRVVAVHVQLGNDERLCQNQKPVRMSLATVPIMQDGIDFIDRVTAVP
jgi:hypothetical protein